MKKVVGINTIGTIPNKIAKYLNLDCPMDYRGHNFRRTSATLLANRGGDFLAIKKHGGWKSSAVAEVMLNIL
jgi:integrase